MMDLLYFNLWMRRIIKYLRRKQLYWKIIRFNLKYLFHHLIKIIAHLLIIKMRRIRYNLTYTMIIVCLIKNWLIRLKKSIKTHQLQISHKNRFFHLSFLNKKNYWTKIMMIKDILNSKILVNYQILVVWMKIGC